MSGPRDRLDVAAQHEPIQRKLRNPEGDSDLPLRSSVKDTASVADLLLRIGNGDAAAWDEIFRRYEKLVSTTIRSFRLQEADRLDATQMTWLRLAENSHRVQFPERLGGWLVTTAQRECLRILRRQAESRVDLVDRIPATEEDPSAGPEQRAIDADTVRKLIAELPPRQQALARMLYTDHPRSYAEVARTTGLPPGAIGPTRARAIRQLRERLHQHGLGPDDFARSRNVERESTEGDRTGSFLIDDLLDKAEQRLREKLESTVTDLVTGSSQGTADTQLNDLLHRADTALRAALSDHENTVDRFVASYPAHTRFECADAPDVPGDDPSSDTVTPRPIAPTNSAQQRGRLGQASAE
jgi:RNA polymerase sigma factor (sigma-70 family)